jgi:hypothetical protein
MTADYPWEHGRATGGQVCVGRNALGGILGRAADGAVGGLAVHVGRDTTGCEVEIVPGGTGRYAADELRHVKRIATVQLLHVDLRAVYSILDAGESACGTAAGALFPTVSMAFREGAILRNFTR